MDEMTTTGPTHVVALENGTIRHFEVTPEEAGLSRSAITYLKGGDAAHNATALMAVLDGARIPYRDIAILNAAAALVIAGKARDLKEGAGLAARALDTRAARATLAELVRVSNRGSAAANVTALAAAR
jgi:anthranilate phosphoribosyltransferase